MVKLRLSLHHLYVVNFCVTLSLYGRRSVFWFFLSMSEFDSRLFAAINDMLLDMLAAVARRDYEQRRERQKQGIEKAKKDGKYKGRKPNQARHDAIIRLIESGSSWTQVQKVLGCSRGTISNALKRKTGQKSSK